MARENVRKGGFYIFLAAFAYALMGVFAKLSYKESNDALIVFMRNVVCLALLLPWVLLPKPKPLKTAFLGGHWIRAIAGLLNMYLFFASIRTILLSDAILLNNTMPLFIPLVLWIWKGQKIAPSLMPGLILGFVGVLVILRPGIELFQPASFLALASGLFMSISMASIQELGKKEPLYRILFYYFALTTLISAFPLFWMWRSLNPTTWAALAAVGLFAAIYQYFLTRGYNYASASKISPVIFTAVILSGLLDWLIWKEAPDLFSLLGALLVIVGAVLCLRCKA